MSKESLIEAGGTVARRSHGDKLLTWGRFFCTRTESRYFSPARKWHSAKEYYLLEYLMLKPGGQVVTKENILENVWGVDGARSVVDNLRSA